MMKLTAAALLALTLFALPVSAENRFSDAFVGYSRAAIEGTGVNGVTGAGAIDLGAADIAVEGSFYSRSITVPTFPGSFTAKGSLYSFRVGPRYTVETGQDRITPFVHALAGYGHASMEQGFSGSVLSGSSATDSLSGLSMAFGGGVDVKAGSLTLRPLQLDYQTLHGSGDSASGIRFSMGVVLKGK